VGEFFSMGGGNNFVFNLTLFYIAKILS